MGQQQLLLVILVTIIVGIATVVAINTFSSAAEGANLDAVRQDVANIAASAQGYYIKPTMLGGGGNTFTGLTFNNITFAADSVIAAGLTGINTNGRYQLTVAAQTITVTAYPASLDGNAGGLAGGAYLEGTVTPNGLAWTNGAAPIQ